MAFLERFTPDERELLVSLPYRAGLWISQADSTGGGAADHDELDALETIIGRQAKGMFHSAFVHEVMVELYRNQEHWPRYARDTDSVLADCDRAVALIGEKLPEHDLAAYRLTLMLIGTEVAKAFREYDNGPSLLGALWSGFKLRFDAFVGAVRGRPYEKEILLNISYQEDIALSKLAVALRHDKPGESAKR